jgi:hypothetical protein
MAEKRYDTLYKLQDIRFSKDIIRWNFSEKSIFLFETISTSYRNSFDLNAC